MGPESGDIDKLKPVSWQSGAFGLVYRIIHTGIGGIVAPKVDMLTPTSYTDLWRHI